MARRFLASASQYLELPSAVVTAAPFSVACWFKPAATNVSYNLLTITNSTATNYFNLYANPTGSSAVIGATSADPVASEHTASTSTTYPANAWSHACGIWTSSTSRSGYLNGGGKGTDATSVTPSGLTQTDIGGLHVGASVFGPFNGPIAEVAIYNAALNDEEVGNLAGIGVDTLVDLPLRIRRINLVAYWKLDGRTSPEWDYSGNGNRIAVVGPTAWPNPDFLEPQPRKVFLLAGSGGGTTSGTAAGTLAKIAGSASGSESNSGDGAGTFGRVVGAAAGASSNPATAAATLARITGSASGSSGNLGSGAGTLSRIIGTVAGSTANPGSEAANLSRITGSASGSALNSVAAEGSLARVAGAANGSSSGAGSGSGTLARIVGSATGSEVNPGSAAGTLRGITASGSSTPINPGIAAGTMDAILDAGSGSSTNPGAASATLARVDGSASGSQSNGGSGSGTLRGILGAATGSSGSVDAGVAAGRLAGIAGAATGIQANAGAGAGLLRRIVGSASGPVPSAGLLAPAWQVKALLERPRVVPAAYQPPSLAAAAKLILFRRQRLANPYPPVTVPHLPTTLATIGYAIQARLVSSGVASPNRVIFSRKKQPFPMSVTPLIVITREQFRAVTPWHIGAGRYNSAQEGIVCITVNHQSSKDQSQQDQYMLMGNPALATPTIGVEQMAIAVMNALHGEFLVDSDGNYLTVEPLEMVGSATPVDYGDTNQFWEGTSLDFRVLYLPKIDLPG